MSLVMVLKYAMTLQMQSICPTTKAWIARLLWVAVFIISWSFFCFVLFCFALAVIMDGSARQMGIAPLLFGLIQTVRLKAAAPAKAS